VLLATLVTTSLDMHAQVEDFEKYSNTKNVTYVYISKSMLSLAKTIAAPSVPGMDMKGVFDKLDAIQVITTDNKSVRTKLRTEVASIVKRDKYEILIQVDEDDSKVKIYFKNDKKQSIIIMSTDEKLETSVIVFSGTFKMDDIQKLTNNKESK